MPMQVPTWQPTTGQLPGVNLSGGGSGQGAAQRIYGQGIQQLADIGSDTAQMIAATQARQREADEALKQIEATTLTTAELAAQAEALGSDPDYATARQRYETNAAKLIKERAQAIGDPKRRALFEQHAQNLTIAHALDLEARAGKARKDRGVAALDDAQQQTLRLAATGNAASRELAAQQFAGALQEQVAIGVIDRTEAGKRWRDWNSGAAEARALGTIRTDPEAALAVLADPAQPDFAALDPVARERMLRTAQSAADHQAADRRAAQERADRLAARHLDERQREAAREMFSRAADEKLDRVWLESRRPHLSPAEYRQGLEMLQMASDGRDDRNLVDDFTIRKYDEDITREVMQARRDGRLKSKTAVGLLEDNKRLLSADGPPPAWKIEIDRLKQVTDPGPMATLVGGQPGAFAVAEALREWRARPNATAAEARQFVDDLIERHAFAVKAQLPIPRFSNRKSETQDDVAAAEGRILDQLDAGRINSDEAANALRDTKAWREHLLRQPAPPAKK